MLLAGLADEAVAWAVLVGGVRESSLVCGQ